MQTNVTSTSINAFHGHKSKSATQRESIVSFIERKGGNWSIGELAKAMGLEKSTVSARVNELLADGTLVPFKNRRDLVSGITVRPVGLSPVQGSLFH